LASRAGWGDLIPTAQYGEVQCTWWLGDAMGALVVAPLLVVWSGCRAQPQGGTAEALAVLLV
jgi:integral membrane sensor domain MASE1